METQVVLDHSYSITDCETDPLRSNIVFVSTGISEGDNEPPQEEGDHLMEGSFASVVQVVPEGFMFVDENCYEPEDEIITPDEWSQENVESIDKASEVPKIRIKNVEELQKPQTMKGNDQYKSEYEGDLSTKYLRNQQQPVSSSDEFIVQESPHFSNENSNCYSNHAVQQNTCPLSGKTSPSKRILKLQIKESLLQERLNRIQRKRELYGKKKRKVKSDKEKKIQGGNIRKKMSAVLQDYSQNRNDDSLTSEKEVLYVSSNLVEGENNNIESKEESYIIEKNEVAAVKEVDVTGVKEGIIQASRTLINTQKTLKLLAKIVSSRDQFKNTEAMNLITKFQNTLKSLQKGIDGVDRTVRNQYKGLFSNKNFCIDSFMEAITKAKLKQEEELRTEQRKKLEIKKKTYLYYANYVPDCSSENTNDEVGCSTAAEVVQPSHTLPVTTKVPTPKIRIVPKKTNNPVPEKKRKRGRPRKYVEETNCRRVNPPRLCAKNNQMIYISDDEGDLL